MTISSSQFSTFCKKLSPIIIIGALLVGTKSQALTIELNDVGLPIMTAEQLIAFEKAADIWESELSDSITVSINVGWLPSYLMASPTALATSTSAKTTHFRDPVMNALVLDTPYQTEYLAYGVQPVSFKVEDYNVVHNGAALRDENQITMTTANAKAIGLTTSIDETYPVPANSADAQIFFNLDYQNEWDLDDEVYAIPKGKRDFIGAAAHEIGHALGFFSVTDWQDDHPTLDAHPNILDIWRYRLTGGDHANSDEDPLLITAGPAEYHDTVLNNIPFSQGKAVYDPYCEATNGNCQASHWRDDAGNLMDPTAPEATRLTLTSQDRHAFDYIGYDLTPMGGNLYSLAHIPFWRALLFLSDPMCRTCFQQIVDGPLADYPIPLNPIKIKPPFKNANYTMLLGFNTNTEGLKNRSATGYAKFVGEKKNTKSTVTRPPNKQDSEQWEQLDMGGEPMKVIPAHLADFYFETDSKNGVKFYFRAIRSKAGIPFNTSLGKYGGFRVSGFIDAMGDKKRGDVDGNMTFELLLNEPVDINKGFDKLSFGIDISTEDNEIKIHDFEAFGLKKPNSNGKR